MEFNSRGVKIFAVLFFFIAVSVAVISALGRRSGTPREVAPVAAPAVPVLPAATAPAAAPLEIAQNRAGATVTSSTETKVQALNDVLTSHNDNDPRLDGELRHLDRETKRAFRARYEKIPIEERNARGTIVFLLGRNLTEKEDFAFVRQVLKEEPCRSLENCGKRPVHVSTEDPPNEMVLNYPQAVALVALGNVVHSGETPPHVRSETIAAIREGARSTSPTVARLSNELLNRLAH